MQYGCIGEHLTHSFSKEIHAALGDYAYELRELSPDALPAFMQAHNFAGINVTIPYKQAVIPFLSDMDDAARAIGAVNTVVNCDGKLYGYNTDFGGMLALIRRAGILLTGKKVLILGTGGTSATAAAVAAHLGAAAVYKVSRRPGGDALTYREVLANHTDADILINTTPRGMFSREAGMPIDPLAFPGLSGVVDAIYHPLRTPLVLRAQSAGIRATGGLYMLVMQAALASRIFTGATYSADAVDAVYRRILSDKENIVLTGMPGCGKTTVGSRIAALLHRPFIDTDAEIVRETGCDIPAIFRERGEVAFRDIESGVVRRAAALCGAVIATGGGAVLREENVEALRSGGRLLFLNRPLDQLVPTSDRPLAGTLDAILSRYRERFPTYLLTSDIALPAGEPPDAVAAAAIDAFFAACN